MGSGQSVEVYRCFSTALSSLFVKITEVLLSTRRGRLRRAGRRKAQIGAPPGGGAASLSLSLLSQRFFSPPGRPQAARAGRSPSPWAERSPPHPPKLGRARRRRWPHAPSRGDIGPPLPAEHTRGPRPSPRAHVGSRLWGVRWGPCGCQGGSGRGRTEPVRVRVRLQRR